MHASLLSPAHPRRDRVRLYDRLAPDYDRLHRRWLRHAGGEAQAALEAAIRALAKPEASLLDVGCGTGAFARALAAERVSPRRMTLLDPSDAMLARCANVPARHVKGRLEALPFRDGEFDIVTCAWALETATNIDLAISELCRVVRPNGVLCLAFCAEQPSVAPTAWLLRQAVLWRGAGLFLAAGDVASMIRKCGRFDVRSVPTAGPASALLARRVATVASSVGSADAEANEVSIDAA